MNRILKRYIVNYRVLPESEERIPGGEITLSSYPAKINSFDDYYLISSGLVVLETTIGNSNKDLWEHVQPNSVSKIFNLQTITILLNHENYRMMYSN